MNALAVGGIVFLTIVAGVAWAAAWVGCWSRALDAKGPSVVGWFLGGAVIFAAGPAILAAIGALT